MVCFIFLFNADLWQPTKSFVIMRMKLQILLQEVWPLPYYLISGVFILQKSFKWMTIEKQEQTNIKISLLVSYYFSDIDLMAFTFITLIFSDQSVFHYISLNKWEDRNFKHSRYKHLYCIFDGLDSSIYFLNSF